jgi:hypothetical protein
MQAPDTFQIKKQAPDSMVPVFTQTDVYTINIGQGAKIGDYSWFYAAVYKNDEMEPIRIFEARMTGPQFAVALQRFGASVLEMDAALKDNVHKRAKNWVENETPRRMPDSPEVRYLTAEDLRK